MIERCEEFYRRWAAKHPNDLSWFDSNTKAAIIEFAEAYAALALRDVPQGQWIDVKERLPEENERVLIWMYEGRLDGFRERFGEICLGHWRPEGGNGNFDSQVSYWQPLPAAPEAARQVPVGPEGKK